MTKKKRNIDWSLKGFWVKIAVMVITVGVGLWCGWINSYDAFYIAVLVQSVNNLYDSSLLLEGYNKFVTVFHVFSFLGAVVAFVISILHFTEKGNIVDSSLVVISMIIVLCIPILHYGIEVYDMIRNNRY